MSNNQSWKIGSSSLLAAGFAELCTIPIDVAKVRLQAGASGMNSSMASVVSDIWKNESPRALYKGSSPSLLRQTGYTAITMIMFPVFKDTICTVHATMNGCFQEGLLGA
eukprot:m.230245 g.230245  ORF g.230245 m.230245 type:complete len:109 (-) comp15997_c1_seq36:670-996(-)